MPDLAQVLADDRGSGYIMADLGRELGGSERLLEGHDFKTESPDFDEGRPSQGWRATTVVGRLWSRRRRLGGVLRRNDVDAAVWSTERFSGRGCVRDLGIVPRRERP